MEIEACTVGLMEALQLFPDISRFRKAFIFTDFMYVQDNFVRAMNSRKRNLVDGWWSPS
jgi:hypothetical protein